MTVLKSASTGFTIQWTELRANINRVATFYAILIKSTEKIILAVETVRGTARTVDIRGLKPSSKYRVSVYGVDDTGQPYKSLESLASTAEGKDTVYLYCFLVVHLIAITLSYQKAKSKQQKNNKNK